ncbi:MAG: 4Fe-4S dicluster domain-containing protein [Candidatus Eremiobacteraeota bacterium]|nr:4Fe-4S dicluster domain-containing protein [Candidatus Eremiobacteraeota bacterium]
MKQYAILQKSHFADFISALAVEQSVMAPVAKGYDNYAFEPVTRASQIALKHIPTILPPKKYFMPPSETILEYSRREGEAVHPVVEYEKMILFGVHTCDLMGVQCLNMALSEHPEDINYLSRKNKIAIIGLECEDYCDEYASCHLMANDLPNGGYDAFFTDLGDYFIIHLNTQMGDDVLGRTKLIEPSTESHWDELMKFREKKRSVFKNEVPVTHQKIKEVFDNAWKSPVWSDIAKRCLACSNCTNVCPTCYCFDVVDEPDLDLITGRRRRKWDSCQSASFARVAGGESFREDRGAKQRHRYYRKFKYPVERFFRYFCTGCGRCSRTCMAKINLKETLTSLVKELN